MHLRARCIKSDVGSIRSAARSKLRCEYKRAACGLTHCYADARTGVVYGVKKMNEIIISDDKSKFPVDEAIELLHKSYWAAERPPEIIKKSIDNSIVFGAYEKDKFVGMARVVTDFATTFYIADVIVDEKYRGKGIGKKLISTIVSDNRFSNLLGILVTRDAHGLYEQFGFVKDSERAMTRRI